MTGVLTFFIPGRPAPQGSKNRGRWGNTYEASEYLPAWRAAATIHARQALKKGSHPKPLFTGPVALAATFYIARPPSHYGTGRNSNTLKPSAPTYPTSPPDLSKLTRAIEDSFTAAGVWKDDGQVVAHDVREYYSPPGKGGALVTICNVTEATRAVAA